MGKKIRFGVFGLGRGGGLIENIFNSGAEVVALCEKRPAAVAGVKQRYPQLENCPAFEDFDEFIQQDMDAVLLANYFIDHAQYAVKAMRAGKHVLSETISNITLAEGVELCRVKEETGMTYALLENYPYFKPNLEMKRLYEEGTLGSLVYAEGESVRGWISQQGNSITRADFGMDVCEFMEQWTKAGPTHHAALAVGHCGSMVEKFGALMNIPVEKIGV